MALYQEANAVVSDPFASTQEPKKKRGGWIKWLPTALGVAGTLAAAPFTGGTSLAGTAALLGGGAALGAGLGEFGAQKLNKEKTDIGNILQESAISGLTGAVPIGGAAKAAKVAGTVAAEEAAAQGAKEATIQAAKDTAKTTGGTGLLSKVRNALHLQGQQMQARPVGFSTGATSKQFAEGLGTEDTTRMLATARRNKISLTNANTAEQQTKQSLDNYGKQISDYFKTNNKVVGANNKKAIVDSFLEKLPTTDPLVRKKADILIADFNKRVVDDKSKWEFRKYLDKIMPKGKIASDEGLTAQQLANRTLRDTIAKDLPKLNAFKEYHALSEMVPFIKKGARELNQPSGGLIGRIASSGPVQALESTTGRAAEKGAELMGAGAIPAQVTERGLLRKVAGEGIKQTVGHGIAGAMFPEQPQPDTTNLNNPDLQIRPDATDTGTEDINAQLRKYALQALASGDTKGLANIMNVAKLFETQDKSLNSTAAQTVTDLQSGLANLTELKSSISNSGSNTPIIGGLLARNPFNTEAKTLQANIALAKQLIGKALEGGVLRKEDEAKYAKILPTLDDSDAVAQNKIDLIISNLEHKLELYQQNLGGSAGGIDLSGLAGATQ